MYDACTIKHVCNVLWISPGHAASGHPELGQGPAAATVTQAEPRQERLEEHDGRAAGRRDDEQDVDGDVEVTVWSAEADDPSDEAVLGQANDDVLQTTVEAWIEGIGMSSTFSAFSSKFFCK